MKRASGQGRLKNGLLQAAAQEMMRMPKYFLSCSRNMKVSTVCGTRRIPAGTRPCNERSGAGLVGETFLPAKQPKCPDELHVESFKNLTRAHT